MKSNLPIRTSPPKLVAGIPWFRRDDYADIKMLMDDGKRMYRAYADWQADAQRMEKNLKGQGVLAYRVVIRPRVFYRWCTDRGFGLDSESRLRFTAESAAKHDQYAR